MSGASPYKKIFLLGFIIVILVAIPFSVYIAQKRQQTTSRAAASTVLSFEPASPTVKVGEILVLNIVLDPGIGISANQVSFAKLSISYDASKFTTLSGSLKANPEPSNTLTTIVDDPKYESGKASISLSIGADPTRAITTKTKIAILQLKAADTTTPIDPNVTFDSAPDTQVLSIASLDQTNENVLSTTIPAKVIIAAAPTGATPTLSPSPSPNPIAIIPTTPPFLPTPKVGLPPSSLDPVCSSLEINGLTNGIAPYSLTFTATGSDPDGIINKISFNFGDSIEALTEGGGIGTNSVNGQISHTYNTPGIYTAYAILTDNNNNLSAQQTSCTKTITISATDISESPQPNEPLPPTGDGKIIFGLGVLGVILTIIGGTLLFL
jgi:hypothetical protein